MANIFQKSAIIRTFHWCEKCDGITKHLLRFAGRVNSMVDYTASCDDCRSVYDRKVAEIKRLSLPNEKAALDAIEKPNKDFSMHQQSWAYLAYHPNYLEWSEKHGDKVSELR